MIICNKFYLTKLSGHIYTLAKCSYYIVKNIVTIFHAWHINICSCDWIDQSMIGDIFAGIYMYQFRAYALEPINNLLWYYCHF